MLREEAHEKGYWHRTVNFIVIDPLTKDVIFQEPKGLEGYNDPNYFIKMNGGHVLAHESIETAFIRELKEELGLTVQSGSAHFAGIYQVTFRPTKVFINREFMYFFMVPYEHAFNAVSFEDGEVGSIIKINIDRAVNLLTGDVESIEAVARDATQSADVVLTKKAFKNFTDDNLYLRIMLAAKRYMDGEDPKYVVI